MLVLFDNNEHVEDKTLNKDLAFAINSSIKDFKATLFIENLNITEVDKDYQVNKIELNLDDIQKEI